MTNISHKWSCLQETSISSTSLNSFHGEICVFLNHVKVTWCDRHGYNKVNGFYAMPCTWKEPPLSSWLSGFVCAKWSSNAIPVLYGKFMGWSSEYNRKQKMPRGPSFYHLHLVTAVRNRMQKHSVTTCCCIVWIPGWPFRSSVWLKPKIC